MTPNKTPILQTQTTITTTQSQNTSQNLSFLETSTSVSDSCDEALITTNVQDTSSIINRPPLPPIPTTRTCHISDPDSVLQYISSCPHRIPTATKTIRKTSLPTYYQKILPNHQQVKLQKKLYQNIQLIHHRI